MSDTKIKRPARKWVGFLFAGIAVVVPVALSLVAIWWIYGWVDMVFKFPVNLFELITGVHVYRFLANMLALILTIALIMMVGMMVATKIGDFFHKKFDGLFARINPLYPPIKKSVGLMIDSFGSDTGLFARVVLVKSALAEGGYLYGLLLGGSELGFLEGDDETLLDVFVIHGPVGNSGFGMIIPKKSLIRAPDGLTVTQFLTETNLRFGAGGKDKCFSPIEAV